MLPKKHWKSRTFLFGSVFGFFIFIFLWNPVSFFSPLRDFFWFSLQPFSRSVHNMYVRVAETGSFLSSIGDLKRENEELFRKNIALRRDQVIISSLQEENDALRKELELAPRDAYVLETASVIGRDSAGAGLWIMIDKGEKQGVQKDMPVIVEEGILIGIVEETFSSRAKVRLLTHPKSTISAVLPATYAEGIVRGGFGTGLIFDTVVRTDVLKESEDVSTSSLGTRVPSGLLLGSVQSVSISHDNLFQQSTLRIPIDYSRLTVVSVIKQ